MIRARHGPSDLIIALPRRSFHFAAPGAGGLAMIIIPGHFFLFLFVVEPVSLSRPKSPYLAPRVVTARAVQRVNACRTIAESFSRMPASARSQCRTATT